MSKKIHYHFSYVIRGSVEAIGDGVFDVPHPVCGHEGYERIKRAILDKLISSNDRLPKDLLVSNFVITSLNAIAIEDDRDKTVTVV